MSEMFATFFQHLLLTSPALLVYVSGMVLAVVCWRRCRAASVLVLLGASVLLSGTVAGTFAVRYMLHSEWFAAMEPEEMTAAATSLGFASQCIHGLGLALVLAAAFVRRGDRVSAGEPDTLDA